MDELSSLGILIFGGLLLRFSLTLTGQAWAKSHAQTVAFMILPVITYVITKTISGNIALSLGMIGVILVVISGNSSPQFSSGTLHLLGDFMALVAGAAMALYSIFYRNIPIEKKPSSQLASFFTFFVGSAISLLIIGFSGDMGSIINFLDFNALYYFLALGILATLLPTLCYAYASSVLVSSDWPQ